MIAGHRTISLIAPKNPVELAFSSRIFNRYAWAGYYSYGSMFMVFRSDGFANKGENLYNFPLSLILKFITGFRGKNIPISQQKREMATATKTSPTSRQHQMIKPDMDWPDFRSGFFPLQALERLTGFVSHQNDLKNVKAGRSSASGRETQEAGYRYPASRSHKARQGSDYYFPLSIVPIGSFAMTNGDPYEEKLSGQLRNFGVGAFQLPVIPTASLSSHGIYPGALAYRSGLGREKEQVGVDRPMRYTEPVFGFPLYDFVYRYHAGGYSKDSYGEKPPGMFKQGMTLTGSAEDSRINYRSGRPFGSNQANVLSNMSPQLMKQERLLHMFNSLAWGRVMPRHVAGEAGNRLRKLNDVIAVPRGQQNMIYMLRHFEVGSARRPVIPAASFPSHGIYPGALAYWFYVKAQAVWPGENKSTGRDRVNLGWVDNPPREIAEATYRRSRRTRAGVPDRSGLPYSQLLIGSEDTNHATATPDGRLSFYPAIWPGLITGTQVGSSNESRWADGVGYSPMIPGKPPGLIHLSTGSAKTQQSMPAFAAGLAALFGETRIISRLGRDQASSMLLGYNDTRPSSTGFLNSTRSRPFINQRSNVYQMRLAIPQLTRMPIAPQGMGPINAVYNFTFRSARNAQESTDIYAGSSGRSLAALLVGARRQVGVYDEGYHQPDWISVTSGFTVPRYARVNRSYPQTGNPLEPLGWQHGFIRNVGLVSSGEGNDIPARPVRIIGGHSRSYLQRALDYAYYYTVPGDRNSLIRRSYSDINKSYRLSNKSIVNMANSPAIANRQEPVTISEPWFEQGPVGYPTKLLMTRPGSGSLVSGSNIINESNYRLHRDKMNYYYPSSISNIPGYLHNGTQKLTGATSLLNLPNHRIMQGDRPPGLRNRAVYSFYGPQAESRSKATVNSASGVYRSNQHRYLRGKNNDFAGSRPGLAAYSLSWLQHRLSPAQGLKLLSHDKSFGLLKRNAARALRDKYASRQGTDQVQGDSLFLPPSLHRVLANGVPSIEASRGSNVMLPNYAGSIYRGESGGIVSPSSKNIAASLITPGSHQSAATLDQTAEMTLAARVENSLSLSVHSEAGGREQAVMGYPQTQVAKNTGTARAGSGQIAPRTVVSRTSRSSGGKVEEKAAQIGMKPMILYRTSIQAGSKSNSVHSRPQLSFASSLDLNHRQELQRGARNQGGGVEPGVSANGIQTVIETEKQESQVEISSAEIRSIADRVYREIQKRMKSERQRHGM